MKKNIESKNENFVIKDASQLWKYLQTNGGVDIKYYDNEIFNSEDPHKNLYTLLDIPHEFENLEKNLTAKHITIERFLVVLLTLLHPYSQMMAELCSFFEKYEIKYSKENMAVKFNFDIARTDSLGFNLEHFREVLKQYQTIEENVFSYKINIDQLWDLCDIFNVDNFQEISNTEVNHWLKSYRHTDYNGVFNLPDIPAPATGHMALDSNLIIVMDIWRSFVNSCRSYGISRQTFRDANGTGMNAAFDRKANVLADGYMLFHAEGDHWPYTFLLKLNNKIREIMLWNFGLRNAALEELSLTVDQFVNSLDKSITPMPRKELAEKVLDLLSLPVWKHRYELYSTWILTAIDKAFEGYDVELHHSEGRMELLFKETHIATIKTSKGDLELWSEVRSPLLNPSSKKRAGNIQPDYRIFHSGDLSLSEKHLLAVEAKQYRKGGKKNFREALNDYAAGLPTAFIFLVNYGPFGGAMDLDFPDRSRYLGQIKPDTEEALGFITLLSKILPKPADKILDLKDYGSDNSAQLFFQDINITEIYVDISGSLDNEEYKTFLSNTLNILILSGEIKKLYAVNWRICEEWTQPDEYSIEKLSSLVFKGWTDFTNLISGSSENILIITDADGYDNCIDKKITSGYSIIYNEGHVVFKNMHS